MQLGLIRAHSVTVTPTGLAVKFSKLCSHQAHVAFHPVAIDFPPGFNITFNYPVHIIPFFVVRVVANNFFKSARKQKKPIARDNRVHDTSSWHRVRTWNIFLVSSFIPCTQHFIHLFHFEIQTCVTHIQNGSAINGPLKWLVVNKMFFFDRFFLEKEQRKCLFTVLACSK